VQDLSGLYLLRKLTILSRRFVQAMACNFSAVVPAFLLIFDPTLWVLLQDARCEKQQTCQSVYGPSAER
jgi:hypothetical protein